MQNEQGDFSGEVTKLGNTKDIKVGFGYNEKPPRITDIGFWKGNLQMNATASISPGVQKGKSLVDQNA